jgi:hypothetical protein
VAGRSITLTEASKNLNLGVCDSAGRDLTGLIRVRGARLTDLRLRVWGLTGADAGESRGLEGGLAKGDRTGRCEGLVSMGWRGIARVVGNGS